MCCWLGVRNHSAPSLCPTIGSHIPEHIVSLLSLKARSRSVFVLTWLWEYDTVMRADSPFKNLCLNFILVIRSTIQPLWQDLSSFCLEWCVISALLGSFLSHLHHQEAPFPITDTHCVHARHNVANGFLPVLAVNLQRKFWILFFNLDAFCSCLIPFSQVLLGYEPELIIVIETHCPQAGGELPVFMNEGGHALVQSMPLTSRLISCSNASSASASPSSSCGFSHLPPPAHAW